MTNYLRKKRTAAIFKDGKLERNLIVVSHNETRITTIKPYGTFRLKDDGEFRWLVDERYIAKLNQLTTIKNKKP